MANPKRFLDSKRHKAEYRPVCERIVDFDQVGIPREDKVSEEQAGRCMDCGTPFCHWGCPIGNYIPEWNTLMFNDHFERAAKLLDATNNLPEVTGRICPAPCEFACVLGINDDPVTVRENELAIIEHAFKNGLIKPNPPKKRTGKKVAVVGSGPAGLACAAQLNKAGHSVTVFEKDDKIGGILRYGIPDFKLEKSILDRRIKLWQAEGIEFKTGINVEKADGFDAVCLACGSREPRDLKIEGRELKGIYFAMEYLVQSNRKVAGEKIPLEKLIDAKGKKVVVIGGGDTGSDCVGTAHRQGAACVVQIELLTMPLILKTSTSHEEGGERHWSVMTKKFKAQNGKLKALECVKVDEKLKEIPGTEFEIEADLVILALGFLRQEIKPEKGIFIAGDMRRGPSLIVWAIAEGRRAAYDIDKYLMGESFLPVM